MARKPSAIKAGLAEQKLKKAKEARRLAKKEKRLSRQIEAAAGAVDTAAAALDEFKRAEADALLDAILNFANKSTRHYEIQSTEAHYRALRDVYVVYLRWTELPLAERQNLLLELAASGPKVNKRDPFRTLLHAMLSYPGPRASINTAVSRDGAVLAYAAKKKIHPDKFVGKLQKSGEGLEAWAKRHRDAHPTKKNPQNQKGSVEVASSPLKEVESITLDLSQAKGLKRDGIYVVAFKYDDEDSSARAVDRVHFVGELDEQEIDRLIDNWIRPVAK